MSTAAAAPAVTVGKAPALQVTTKLQDGTVVQRAPAKRLRLLLGQLQENSLMTTTPFAAGPERVGGKPNKALVGDPGHPHHKYQRALWLRIRQLTNPTAGWVWAMENSGGLFYSDLYDGQHGPFQTEVPPWPPILPALKPPPHPTPPHGHPTPAATLCHCAPRPNPTDACARVRVRQAICVFCSMPEYAKLLGVGCKKQGNELARWCPEPPPRFCHYTMDQHGNCPMAGSVGAWMQMAWWDTKFFQRHERRWGTPSLSLSLPLSISLSHLPQQADHC